MRMDNGELFYSGVKHEEISTIHSFDNEIPNSFSMNCIPNGYSVIQYLNE